MRINLDKRTGLTLRRGTHQNFSPSKGARTRSRSYRTNYPHQTEIHNRNGSTSLQTPAIYQATYEDQLTGKQYTVDLKAHMGLKRVRQDQFEELEKVADDLVGQSIELDGVIVRETQSV